MRINANGNKTETPFILEVKNIKKYFPIKGGIFKRTINQLKAVDDISFHRRSGEALGIGGESGSGKSTLGRVILRLLEPTEGHIVFNGVDISYLRQGEIRKYRNDMQIVFQDPFGSLNSKMSVSELIE